VVTAYTEYKKFVYQFEDEPEAATEAAPEQQ